MNRLRIALRRLTDWWVFLDVHANDVDIATVGDKGYVIAHTGRWFKRCISIEVDRDQFADLADMIRDSEEDAADRRAIDESRDDVTVRWAHVKAGIERYGDAEIQAAAKRLETWLDDLPTDAEFEDISEPCHCGKPIYIHDEPPGFTRGLCEHCDTVRCDAYPGACRKAAF